MFVSRCILNYTISTANIYERHWTVNCIENGERKRASAFSFPNNLPSRIFSHVNFNFQVSQQFISTIFHISNIFLWKCSKHISVRHSPSLGHMVGEMYHKHSHYNLYCVENLQHIILETITLSSLFSRVSFSLWVLCLFSNRHYLWSATIHPCLFCVRWQDICSDYGFPVVHV